MTRKLEWPTLLLAAAIYSGWLAVTLLHRQIPAPLLAVLGGWLVAWHGSLQHETIHGHPTGSRLANAALAAAPLSLWLPYTLYRRSHLEHHRTEQLTCPGADPEARYLAAPPRLGLARWLARLQSTLAGRIVLGPAFEVGTFLAVEANRAARGEGDARVVWAGHLIAVGLLLAWLHWACDLSLGTYIACFAYPGAALSSIRSFAEHRAAEAPRHRVAVVEGAPLLGLLFLNNNLHALHHARPGLSWWRLPAVYNRDRAQILEANGSLVYAGYAEVFRRFLFRPHDVLIHPCRQAELA